MSSFKFENTVAISDVVMEYPSSLEEMSVPLIIDNGSYHCRVGWASSQDPELTFKNVIAKNRGNRKERDWDIQVANEITDLEAVRWFLRSPYDYNVIVNYSVQETLFDYAFKHMGINKDGAVPHPIVITEPIVNPPHCRKYMSELMFEAYSIPKLAYGIDCLFSRYYYYREQKMPETALIVSSGFRSTYVLPVVDNYPDVKNCLRINLGGYNCSAYLQRLLQLKYPQFTSELNLSRMEQIIHKLCSVAHSYDEEVRSWCREDFNVNNTTTLQLHAQEQSSKSVSTDLKSYDPLALEKKLKQTEYKLHEVECVLELENENPEVAISVAKDAGCTDLEQLKEKAENIRSDIQAIRAELNELYHAHNSAKKTVKCSIEKIQSPEIIFQPSLVGFDQCGLSECIQFVLQRYSLEIQDTLAQNVFVTGGNTKTKGFKERLFVDLKQMRPYQSKINITCATNPSLDAWKGASKWALADHSLWIGRHEFEECGWEYLKEHEFSNKFCKKTSTD